MPNGIKSGLLDSPDVLLEFLEVCFNSILFSRKVYPASIFVLKKKYNIPVHISIFPDLNQYIFEVLSAIKSLYVANELKLISFVLLNEYLQPVEKYNFNLEGPFNSTSPWPGKETSVNLNEIHDSFRSFCLKLSLLDCSLKSRENTSFKIYIETTASSQQKIYKEPNFQNFPWIPTETTNEEFEAELIPIKTISAGSINLEIYVEV